jgi:magnesium transporter
MSEVVSELMRRDLHIVGDDLMPYYQDVYDQVLRAGEWTDGLRDLVTSILETNLTIQGNRLNVTTKKVTGWAAIIAVPTLITGYFGMNVPYPGFGGKAGWCSTSSSNARTGCKPKIARLAVSPRSTGRAGRSRGPTAIVTSSAGCGGR